MQRMWLYLYSGKQFEEIFENTQWREVRYSINATLPVLIQFIWVNIWNHTAGKSQINATSSKPEGGSSITESTFQVQAARLFNSLPKKVCNVTKCGAGDFKAQLDAYLSPDTFQEAWLWLVSRRTQSFFKRSKMSQTWKWQVGTIQNVMEGEGNQDIDGEWKGKQTSDQERITMKVLFVLTLKPVWSVQVWVKSFVESSLTKS